MSPSTSRCYKAPCKEGQARDTRPDGTQRCSAGYLRLLARQNARRHLYRDNVDEQNIDNIYRRPLAGQAPAAIPNQRPGTGSRRAQGPGTAARPVTRRSTSREFDIDNIYRGLLAEQAPPAIPNQRPGTGTRRAQGPGTAARQATRENEELLQALTAELKRTAALPPLR